MGNVVSSVTDIFDTKTIIVTWDTLHIMLTLAIYITLVIFIWATKLDPCKKNVLSDECYERERPDVDKGIPRCLSGQSIMYA